MIDPNMLDTTPLQIIDGYDVVTEGNFYTPKLYNEALDHARVALVHLLKMVYQPEKQSTSWLNSITREYVETYYLLVDKSGNLNTNTYKDFVKYFDKLEKSSVSYAAEEMGKNVNDIKLTYGMGPRAFLSKEWLNYFMSIMIQKDNLKDIYFESEDFAKKISSLPDINKYDLKKINKELGEPEIYD